MRTTDVAVVGGGPAGVAAALAAASAGKRVTLLDENEAPGGTLRWSLDLLGEESGGCRAHALALEFAAQLRDAWVTFVPNAVAWGLFEERMLAVSDEQSSYRLQAGAVVLATGATDITLPFDGWELPGIFTATAFLRAVVLHRVRPGQAIVVVGDGAEARSVIDTARTLGVTVVGQSASPATLAVRGTNQVQQAVIDGTVHAADCVVLALGRQPDAELALQALCDIEYSPASAAQVVRRDAQLMTSYRGVYAVGDCAGLCSLPEAVAEGRLAGYAAAGSERVAEAALNLASLRRASRAGELDTFQIA